MKYAIGNFKFIFFNITYVIDFYTLMKKCSNNRTQNIINLKKLKIGQKIAPKTMRIFPLGNLGGIK